MNAQLRWVVPVCAVLLLAVPMSATPLAVGGVVFTSDDTGAPTGTILASILNVAYSTPAVIGKYSTWVVRNGGGTLDFYYQVFFDPASPDPIGRLTMFNFGAPGVSLVDVVSRIDGNTVFGAGALNGDELPLFADRTAATVGFNYKVLPGLCTCDPFEPSSTSILGIKTNATDYAAGILNIIDGSVAAVPAFAPIAAPEPGTYAMLGAGLLGLAMLRRKRA
jgi:hypothetical protein